MAENTEEQVLLSCNIYLNLLRDIGAHILPDAQVLDFGCGSGQHVYFLRKLGFRAYGCDIANKSEFDRVKRRLGDEGLASNGEDALRAMELPDYRIPFENNKFDFLFSNQVFEHVQNYSEALTEIKRVLKPGGWSIHIFPSRYRFFEGHVYVPFGGILQGRRYLTFWAFMGIRNSFQNGLSYQEVARLNNEYLPHQTKYYPKKELRRLFCSQFANTRFIESFFLKYSRGRSRYLHKASKVFPIVSNIYSTLHTRIVAFQKPQDEK